MSVSFCRFSADATEAAVAKICAEAKEYGFMSVCVNTYYTAFVAEQLKDSNVKVCTVVGFPLGQMSTKAKALETQCARLMKRDNITYQQAETRILKQTPYSDMLKKADYVINNNKDVQGLILQGELVLRQLEAL